MSSDPTNFEHPAAQSASCLGSSDPGSADPISSGDYAPELSSKLPVRSVIALFLVSAAVSAIYALLTLPLLGVPEIYQVSEGREGVVVDEILRTGELILPLRHGIVVPSKPMLYHWLAVAAADLTGRDDELILRLPSLLAASLLLGSICFVTGRINRGRLPQGPFAAGVAGGAAATYLGLCLGFFRQATDSRVDMVFLALAIGAIIFLYEPLILRAVALTGTKYAGSKINRNELNRTAPFSNLRLFGFAVLIGLSVLAKGPIGIVLPVLVVVPYALLIGGWRGVSWFLAWPAALAVIIPLPWYVLAVIKGGSSFIGRQLFFENIGRFVGAAGITGKPLWFYLPHLLEQAAPLAELLLFWPAALLYAPFRRHFGGVLRRFEPIESAQIKFALIWIVNLFLFFSAATGKRASYLVAILPPIAISFTLVSFRFAEILKAESRPVEKAGAVLKFPFTPKLKMAGNLLWGAIPIIFSAAYLAGILAKRTPENSSNGFFRTVFAFADVVSQAPAVCFSYLVFFVFSGGWFWYSGHRRRRSGEILFSSALIWALAVFLAYPLVQGVRGVTHGYKKFAGEVSAAIPPEEKLTFIKATSDESFDGFFFYVKRRIDLADPGLPPAEAGVYLARSSWIDRQADGWKAAVEPLLRGGRQVDTPEKELVLFRYQPPPPEAKPLTE